MEMADDKNLYQHPKNYTDKKQKAFQVAKTNAALLKRTESCKNETKVALPKNALQ